jgi:hypothetical protein
VSLLSRDGLALMGFAVHGPWRGRAAFADLLVTSGSSLRVPGRSPHPPWPCRSPGGPSRAPSARRPACSITLRRSRVQSQRPWSSLPFRAADSRPGRFNDHLSWDSPVLVHTPYIAAQPAFQRPITPPSTCSPASTPSAMSPPHLRPLANQTRSPVPTSWFRTTSPGFSAAFSVRRTTPFGASRVAGLLHPATDPGVRRVSDPTILLPGRPSPSRDATHPSKDSTRSQPYRVSTALAFLTFTLRALRASRVRVSAPTLQLVSRVEPAFKALLCVRVRTTVRRFRRPMAYPPVGFYVPLQGPSLNRPRSCGSDRLASVRAHRREAARSR